MSEQHKKDYKTLKGVIRSAVFLLIMCVVLTQTTSVLVYYDHDFVSSDMMYKQPKNSIDALFIGSSIYARGISPNIIWKKSGISSYNRSSGSLSAAATYLYLKDSLKYQNPQVVFLYTPQLTEEYKGSSNMQHRNIDPLKFSPEKAVVAYDIQEQTEKGDAVGHIFPLLYYHGRWERALKMRLAGRVTKEDFSHGQSPRWGVRSPSTPDVPLLGRIKPGERPDFSFNESSLNYYKKAIEACLAKGIVPVLLSLPSTNWDNELHHASSDLADMYGIDFIDMNTDELLGELGIDPRIDFYDPKSPEHMNGVGAAKVSAYLIAYMESRLQITGAHGNNSAVSLLWEKDSKKYKSQYKKYFEKQNQEMW